MKLVLKVLVVLLSLVVLTGAGVYVWASTASNRILARTFEVHSVDAGVPFPLSEEEIAELGLSDEEADEVALERALERGRHLIEARYACTECHGQNLAGGVMVDDPMIGRLLGPNLTLGEGSVTEGYIFADWDQIVRHGVRSDGRPAAMPAEDFVLMSDEELSDIITYVRSQPDVDNTVPAPKLGPLGKVLMATGQLQLSVDLIDSHEAMHVAVPPASEVTAEFGGHLAGVCTGCHGMDLAGQAIPGGDPSWPPSQNLTSHADALGSWSFQDFQTAMLQGTRPDGSALLDPMTVVVPYAQQMTDVELEALWTYLRTIPAVASTQ